MSNELVIGVLVVVPFFGIILLWLGAIAFDFNNDDSEDGIR